MAFYLEWLSCLLLVELLYMKQETWTHQNNVFVVRLKINSKHWLKSHHKIRFASQRRPTKSIPVIIALNSVFILSSNQKDADTPGKTRVRLPSKYVVFFNTDILTEAGIPVEYFVWISLQSHEIRHFTNLHVSPVSSQEENSMYRSRNCITPSEFTRVRSDRKWCIALISGLKLPDQCSKALASSCDRWIIFYHTASFHTEATLLAYRYLHGKCWDKLHSLMSEFKLVRARPVLLHQQGWIITHSFDRFGVPIRKLLPKKHYLV